MKGQIGDVTKQAAPAYIHNDLTYLEVAKNS
jgi:hypothetical protein